MGFVITSIAVAIVTRLPSWLKSRILLIVYAGPVLRPGVSLSPLFGDLLRCARIIRDPMALDSAATFSSRVRDLGLGGLLDRFLDLGWSNLGALAFFCGDPGGAVVGGRF